MLRRFKFEEEVYESLSCVPMAVRRKLDRVGVKISLGQWQGLGRGERLAICHLPAESVEEREVMKVFMEEAVRNRCGSATKPVTEEMRRAAEPPASPPPALVASAKAEGVELTQSAWEGLNADERYALIKLGGGEKQSHNLVAALRELVGQRGRTTSSAG
ncbi:MAG TPA: nitrate reductase associated protein [Candidatus Binataceae bacterium]|nr:nitrate reductase associated protein [Candidatus Binataceae bacterium]